MSSVSHCGNVLSYLSHSSGVWIGSGVFLHSRKAHESHRSSVRNWLHLDKWGWLCIRELHTRMCIYGASELWIDFHYPGLLIPTLRWQHLRGSCGPRCIEDIERVVGGKRDAVVRLGFGHLFVPVQAQLWTQRNLLLKDTDKWDFTLWYFFNSALILINRYDLLAPTWFPVTDEHSYISDTSLTSTFCNPPFWYLNFINI